MNRSEFDSLIKMGALISFSISIITSIIIMYLSTEKYGSTSQECHITDSRLGWDDKYVYLYEVSYLDKNYKLAISDKNINGTHICCVPEHTYYYKELEVADSNMLITFGKCEEKLKTVDWLFIIIAIYITLAFMSPVILYMNQKE